MSYGLDDFQPEDVRAARSRKPTKRRRGDHSVACKNPNPFYRRPDGNKPLPGQLGKCYNRLVKFDRKTGEYSFRRRLSRDPFYVYMRDIVGRKRDFRPEKENLIDAMAPAFLSRCNLSTSRVVICISSLAEELGVTVSRLSRALKEQAEFCVIELSDLEWDPYQNCFLPRHIILTERFFKMCGADLDKLREEQETRLQAEHEGWLKPGEQISIKAARRREFDRIRTAALMRRRELAIAQKKLKRFDAGRDFDETKQIIAAHLIKTIPRYELQQMSPDDFEAHVAREHYQYRLSLDDPPG